MAEKIDGLKEGALKEATNNAMQATAEYVTTETDKAVASSRFNFNRTGTTKASVVHDPQIEWQGTRASVKTGFNISDGGLPSIFLMYGTPHIKPDTKLKAAAKGTGKHRKELDAIQAREFNKVLEEAMQQND